jgi:hypothetical protein
LLAVRGEQALAHLRRHGLVPGGRVVR